MGHKHGVRDTGAHFTIDQYTRAIKNESANKTTIVQFDHNSEQITFSMPLMIDGHAITLCDLIEIHFINISTDGNSQNHGTYEVQDIKADGDKAVFTWLISQNATQLVGSLNFIIVFKCVEDGVTVYRWSTEICKTLSVSSGMDNGEEVLADYPDIIAQWKADLFGVGDTEEQRLRAVSEEQQAAIEAKGQAVLDSIPDGVASGIKGNLFGTVVQADDVSQIKHTAKVKISGKNLFNVKNIELVGDANISISSVSENSLTITTGDTYTNNGVMRTGKTLHELAPLLEAGKTYVISAETQSYFKRIVLHEGDNDTFYFGQSFIPTEKDLSAVVYLYGLAYNKNQGTGDCVISNIQIELGDTATEYTPYIAPETVTVRRCGKNLIPFPYPDYGVTETNGLTATLLDDGGIVLNGSVTSDAFVNLAKGVFISHETVTPKSTHGIISNGVTTGVYTAFDANNGITFVAVKAGTECNNTVFYPQIEVGAVPTEYEQGVELATFTPSADGTVFGVTSVAPNMTILADTPGVTVECEYIVDTKTYIDNKIAELLEGSEQE